MIPKKKVVPTHFNHTFEQIFPNKTKTSSLGEIKKERSYVLSLLVLSENNVFSGIFIEKKKELVFKVKQVYQKKQSFMKPKQKKN